jgi:hypothetical protein
VLPGESAEFSAISNDHLGLTQKGNQKGDGRGIVPFLKSASK